MLPRPGDRIIYSSPPTSSVESLNEHSSDFPSDFDSSTDHTTQDWSTGNSKHIMKEKIILHKFGLCNRNELAKASVHFFVKSPRKNSASIEMLLFKPSILTGQIDGGRATLLIGGWDVITKKQNRQCFISYDCARCGLCGECDLCALCTIKKKNGQKCYCRVNEIYCTTTRDRDHVGTYQPCNHLMENLYHHRLEELLGVGMQLVHVPEHNPNRIYLFGGYINTCASNLIFVIDIRYSRGHNLKGFTVTRSLSRTHVSGAIAQTEIIPPKGSLLLLYVGYLRSLVSNRMVAFEVISLALSYYDTRWRFHIRLLEYATNESTVMPLECIDQNRIVPDPKQSQCVSFRWNCRNCARENYSWLQRFCPRCGYHDEAREYRGNADLFDFFPNK